MYQIEVANIKIGIIRKNIKNLHLSVYPPFGDVRVSSPQFIGDDALRLFVVSRLQWIKQQQRKFQAQERETPREYAYRETHYFMGKKYLLNVIESTGRPKIDLKTDSIDLYIKKDASIDERKVLMLKWYRRELKKLIPGLLAKWQPIVGAAAADWGVKLMKTKWGTCNRTAKRIWLNLELIKKPLYCLEYVIVHELVHLHERQHNAQFKQYMNTFMPKWKQYKAELNALPLGPTSWNY